MYKFPATNPSEAQRLEAVREIGRLEERNRQSRAEADRLRAAIVERDETIAEWRQRARDAEAAADRAAAEHDREEHRLQDLLIANQAEFNRMQGELSARANEAERRQQQLERRVAELTDENGDPRTQTETFNAFADAIIAGVLANVKRYEQNEAAQTASDAVDDPGFS